METRRTELPAVVVEIVGNMWFIFIAVFWLAVAALLAGFGCWNSAAGLLWADALMWVALLIIWKQRKQRNA